MNVPLIQKPETNDINASLIAIRKQLQILNESVNNIENKYLLKSELKELSADTVGGDGKYIESISENNGIINAVEKSLGNMTPVDTVTSGNTHSVTSGAVYEVTKTEVTNFSVGNATFTYFKIGNINILNCSTPTVVGNYLTFNLGDNIRAPRDNVTFIMWQNTTGSGGTAYNNYSQTMCLAQILPNKTLRVYGASGLGGAGTPYQTVLGCAIWAS